MKKEIMTSFFLASAAGMLAVGCSGSPALAQSQPAAPAAPVASVPAFESAGLHAGGGYGDGYSLGLRNGSIIVSRLKQRTTDLRGCAAIGQLEGALLSVSRTVRPPYSGETGFVGGFYSGYVDSIRSTLGKVRRGCGLGSYSSGEFAGQFYGAVACQVQSISLEAISQIQIQPLYDGWSGGSSSVQASCQTTLLATLESCTDGAEISGELEAVLSVSCSDQASGDSRN
jgi:hypothetical protein